jgi:hypothetical protein
MIQSIEQQVLPGTGRGTIRRMVEGRARKNPASRDMCLPLHHFVVPLPVPGRS